MAKLQCEICGGGLVAKSGGLFECEYCGMQYDRTRIQEMVQEIKGTVKVEGTVDVKGTVKIEGPVEVKGSATAKSLIRRMEVCAKNKQYDKIPALAEQVLNIEPESSEAYLWLLLAECECASLKELFELPLDELEMIPEESENWENAVRWCSKPGKPTLEEQLNTAIKRAKDQEEKERAQHEIVRQKEAVLIKKRYEQIKPVQDLLYVGYGFIVALKANGDVLVTHDNFSYEKFSWLECVKRWTGVKKIQRASSDCIAALRWDGTMLVAYKEEKCKEYAKQIRQWKNIVDFCCYDGICVGLTSTGKLVSAIYSRDEEAYYCLSNLNNKWENIKQLCICRQGSVNNESKGSFVDVYVVIGLTEDGRTVISDISMLPAPCYKHILNMKLGQWENVREVIDSTYILQNDGTLWDVTKTYFGKPSLEGYNMLSVGIRDNGDCSAYKYTWIDNVVKKSGKVALLLDGTVAKIVEGSSYDDEGYADPIVTPQWVNMVDVLEYHGAIANRIVGLRADGSVLIARLSGFGPPEESETGWKLFESLETFQAERDSYGLEYEKKAAEKAEEERIAQEKKAEEERIAREKRMAEESIAYKRRNAGLCQHCGGELKGFFSKKCISCGRPKDY